MHETLLKLLSENALGRPVAEGGVRSYAGGRFLDGSGGEVVVEDPSTGAELVRYRDFGTDGIGQVVASANAAQRAWAALTADKRAKVLLRVAQEIEVQQDWLASVESLTAGRPIKDCLGQVERVSDMFVYYAGWADKLYGEVVPVPNGSSVE